MIKIKFYIIILILIFVHIKSFGQKFTIIDSIKVEQPTFFVNDNEYLLIGNKKGDFFQYNILKKELNKKLNFSKPITKIETNKNYLAIITDNELYVYEKKTLILKKEIKINKTIFGIAFNNSNIYFGGKSGILYKNNIENKHSNSEEIYKTIKNNYLFWITDIDIQNDSLYMCAGNLYIFDLYNFQLSNEINDKNKNFTICQPIENHFYFFKSKEKLFIKSNSNFTITDTLFTNSYLTNPFIKQYNDSTLFLTINNKLLLFDTKHKKIDTIVKNKKIILATYSPYIVYNLKNSIYFLQDTSRITKIEIDKNVILKDINFKSGKTYFSNSDSINAIITINRVTNFYHNNKEKIANILILGYTEKTNLQWSLTLSNNRALRIKNELINYNIPENIIITVGKGNSLKYKNNNSWKNRRVKIKFISKKAIKNEILNLHSKNGWEKDTIKKTTQAFVYLNNEITNIELNENLSYETIENNKIIYFRISAWTAETIPNQKPYYYGTIVDNDSILINRDVSIRVGAGTDYSRIGKKGINEEESKYKLIGKQKDNIGYIWYNFYLYGYYILNEKK